MNINVSTSHWALPNGSAAVDLEPTALLRAGILRDPKRPEQAVDRARSLSKHGRYREARNLILPHAHTATGRLRVAMFELLARCAMYGAGGDWEALLRTALDAHEESGDSLGAARTRRDLGEMLAGSGRYDEADTELHTAGATFRRYKDTRGMGLVECVRGRLRSRAGFVDRGQARINKAMNILAHAGDARGLAMSQLERARTFAMQCDGEAAARDLLAAERYLSVSGAAADRVRTKLARAECLHLLGDSRRAASGLERVFPEILELEGASIRAWTHALLGETLGEDAPSAARTYLTRARHLYEAMGQGFHVARCNIALAAVERQLGLNALGRLKTIPSADLAAWPLLQASYNLVRAQVDADTRPEQCQAELQSALRFAEHNGNLALARRVAAGLEAAGWADAQVKPAADPAPLAEVESNLAPPPTPFCIDDPVDLHALRPAPLRLVQAAPEPRTALQPLRPAAVPRARAGVNPAPTDRRGRGRRVPGSTTRGRG